jgi:hypothetical protein
MYGTLMFGALGYNAGDLYRAYPLLAGSSGLSMTLRESWGHVSVPLASCHQRQDGRQPSNRNKTIKTSFSCFKRLSHDPERRILGKTSENCW